MTTDFAVVEQGREWMREVREALQEDWDVTIKFGISLSMREGTVQSAQLYRGKKKIGPLLVAPDKKDGSKGTRGDLFTMLGILADSPEGTESTTEVFE